MLDYDNFGPEMWDILSPEEVAALVISWPKNQRAKKVEVDKQLKRRTRHWHQRSRKPFRIQANRAFRHYVNGFLHVWQDEPDNRRLPVGRMDVDWNYD